MFRIIVKLFSFWPKSERTFTIDNVCDAQIIDLEDDPVFQNVQKILADVCGIDPASITLETELLKDLELDWGLVDKILFQLRDTYPEVPFPNDIEGLLALETVADVAIYINGYHGKVVTYH